MRNMIFLGSLVVLAACGAKTEVQSDSTQTDSVTALPAVITEDTATVVTPDTTPWTSRRTFADTVHLDK
jgi:hypothetical protein